MLTNLFHWMRSSFESRLRLRPTGVGVSTAPSGNGIAAVDIRHFDNVAPNAISSVSASPFRDRVDLQWREPIAQARRCIPPA